MMQSKRSISTETGGKWAWHLNRHKARRLDSLFSQLELGKVIPYKKVLKGANVNGIKDGGE